MAPAHHWTHGDFLGPFCRWALFLLLLLGCRENTRPTVTRPAESSSTSPSPDSVSDGPAAASPSPTAATPGEPKPQSPPRLLKRPVDSWIIFRSAADPNADVLCNYQWTGDNRLEVVTENVTRLTLDLTKLPPGAPRRGPWNLQIDQQGIQITGVRGRVLDLIRSPNGIWAVDREKSPRRD